MFWKMPNYFVQIWIASRPIVAFTVRLLLFLLLSFQTYFTVQLISRASRGRYQRNISPEGVSYKWSYDVELGKQMWRLLLQRWKVPSHGNLISSVFKLTLLLLEYVRKKKIGAIKNDQRWRVFSNWCPIPVLVIWLLSVVNHVLR